MDLHCLSYYEIVGVNRSFSHYSKEEKVELFDWAAELLLEEESMGTRNTMLGALTDMAGTEGYNPPCYVYTVLERVCRGLVKERVMVGESYLSKAIIALGRSPDSDYLKSLENHIATTDFADTFAPAFKTARCKAARRKFAGNGKTGGMC